MLRLQRPVILVSVLGITSPAAPHELMDRALRAEIARIEAIDNHTHDDPVRDQRGSGWRAKSPLGSARYPDVAPLRRDDPQWIRARKALCGYRYADFAPEHLMNEGEISRPRAVEIAKTVFRESAVRLYGLSSDPLH